MGGVEGVEAGKDLGDATRVVLHVDDLTFWFCVFGEEDRWVLEI